MTLKKKLGKNIRQFLVDTNLFIAAIKSPKKETNSLKLLLELIDSTDIVLIGNEFLIMEMEKYAQVFESKRGREILQKLIDKIEVVDVDEKFLRLCKSYFPEEELIDVYHAASCLQEFMKLLNLNEETGSLTALVKFPAGFVEPRHSHSVGHVVYVIENELGNGKSAYTEGTYWYAPANDIHGPVEQKDDCTFLLVTDGPLDFNLK